MVGTIRERSGGSVEVQSLHTIRRWKNPYIFDELEVEILAKEMVSWAEDWEQRGLVLLLQ